MLNRFIFALSRAILRLNGFYAAIPSGSFPYYDYTRPFVRYEAESPAKRPKASTECFFPYLDSYKKLDAGQAISFEYKCRMLPGWLLFQAIESISRKQIVIKFTRRYGMEVHQLLAERDPQLAPKLYGCECLPGGWKMVVMEYLPGEDWVALETKQPSQGEAASYKEQLEGALKLLKVRRWVHGDIRHANILVPKSNNVTGLRLLDFDYSGIEDQDIYPRDWNHTFRPQGAVAYAKMKVGHDETMLNNLFEYVTQPSGTGIRRMFR